MSITELLTLLEALKAGLGDCQRRAFYHLARTCLVKDERYYDRFDQAFAAHFQGRRATCSRAPRASCRPTGWRRSAYAT